MKSVAPVFDPQEVSTSEPNRMVPSSVISLVIHALLFLCLIFGFDRQGVPEGAGETFHDVGLFQKDDLPDMGGGPQGSPDGETTAGNQGSDAEVASSESSLMDALPEPHVEAETGAESVAGLPLQLPETATIGAGAPLPTGLPSAAASRSTKAAGTGRIHGATGGRRGGGSGSRFGRSDGTSFFQITAQGQHFYYVVDCSGSMSENNAIGVARAELMASVERLDSTKRFQILFYDSELHPMLNGKQNVFFATDINRTFARQFINAQQPNSGTMHQLALVEALRSAPNVMFFLSDGDTPELTQRDLKNLRESNRNNTQIHVVQFGRGAKQGPANWLEQLAKDNQGTYRYRNVSDFQGE